jgi:hypothetical protein
MDLGGLATRLEKLADVDIREKAAKARTALTDAVFYRHGSTTRSGLSIRNPFSILSAYRELAWAVDTTWDEFTE